MSEPRYTPSGVISWESFRWAYALVRSIPGVVGVWFRWAFLSLALKSTSGPFRVLEGVTIEFPKRLSIGSHVGVNRGAWINARGGISIGDDTIVGPYCVIHSANHRMSDADTPVRLQGYETAEVRIGRDVWLGAHCVVLPGVTIGDRAVVGAGAVVTADVEAGAIVAGVPAREIGRRA